MCFLGQMEMSKIYFFRLYNAKTIQDHLRLLFALKICPQMKKPALK